MKLYFSRSVGEFCRSVKTNEVFPSLREAFVAAYGRAPAPAEEASWAASLPRLAGAIELAGLPHDARVALEARVPYYSERIDALLLGHDEVGRPGALLVELKQWSEVEPAEDGLVVVRMRGGLVRVVHPSLQVDGYRRHLANFVRAFQNGPAVALAGCVYAHNYPRRSGPLFDSRHAHELERAPVFCATDAEKLAAMMRAWVGGGRGREVSDRIEREGLAPSRALVERAAEIVRTQDVFTMLDEQIPAQRAIITAVGRATRSAGKTVVLVEGGPGTGKSVIALDALGQALRQELGTFLVSGSAAFTHGMRRLLGQDLASLVRFTDYFWNHPPDSVDVMVVDEAHRIRGKSVPKVVAALRPKISQLEELVRAARVTVLFMDKNQIIEPVETGDPEEVEALCRHLGVRFSRHSLRAQFRCNGSDDYLRWADRLLELRDSPDAPLLLKSPETFDFDVLDTPDDVLDWVRAKNAAEASSARIAAGWCWPWSDPRPDGSLVDDIVIGRFRFPWELKNGKRGRPGIPEAKHWAVDPAGAEQAGTVYSVQGFEFRHVGVLMGPDLVVREGRWVADPKANFRRGIRGKAPEVASVYIRRIYRALLTRPLRSLRLFSVDPETRSFVRSRLNAG